MYGEKGTGVSIVHRRIQNEGNTNVSNWIGELLSGRKEAGV